MTDFLRTMDLLEAAGIPLRVVDPATVSYWLTEKGYSPERVVAEIFDVQPSTLRLALISGRRRES